MRLLTLTLDLPLHPGNLIGFRACLVELIGREHSLFHNHINDPEEHSSKWNWGYPLIQYGIRKGKAAITGIDVGAKAIEEVLVPCLRPDLHFAGRTHTMNGFRIEKEEAELQLASIPQLFAVIDWLALNQENYTRWKQEDSPCKRLDILSQALTGHLRAVANQLGFLQKDQIIGRILCVNNQKKIKWHGVELVRFNVFAECNLSFPIGIGLGRGVAFGFGETLSLNAYHNLKI